MLVHGAVAAAMLPLAAGRTRAALLRATARPSSALVVGSYRPSHPLSGRRHRRLSLLPPPAPLRSPPTLNETTQR